MMRLQTGRPERSACFLARFCMPAGLQAEIRKAEKLTQPLASEVVDG